VIHVRLALASSPGPRSREGPGLVELAYDPVMALVGDGNSRRRRGGSPDQKIPRPCGSRNPPRARTTRSATPRDAREPWRAHRTLVGDASRRSIRAGSCSRARSGPTRPRVDLPAALAYRKLTALYCDSASVFLSFAPVFEVVPHHGAQPSHAGREERGAPHRRVLRSAGTPGKLSDRRKALPIGRAAPNGG